MLQNEYTYCSYVNKKENVHREAAYMYLESLAQADVVERKNY